MNVDIYDDNSDFDCFFMKFILKWANTYDMNVLFLDIFFSKSHIDEMMLTLIEMLGFLAKPIKSVIFVSHSFINNLNAKYFNYLKGGVM